MNDMALANALAFADWGFGVFSVWGVKEGECRCPKGAACTSPGKHPIPIDGLKSATSDTERVAKMLAAPGSQGQYGVVPAPHIIVLDVDGEGWQEKLRDLGLPRTFAVQTANGVHLYFYWPSEYGPQPTRLHGWVVRSLEHPGYVIGPGSEHVSGATYRIAHQNGHDIYMMLSRITVYPEPPKEAGLTLVVSEGLRTPESIGKGGRHDYLRDRARTLRGGGLTGEDLFRAVDALNQRLPEPKSAEEVRRAIGDVETKFSEDPLPPDIEQVSEGLFIPVAEYRAAQPTKVDWVSPLAAYGFVSLIAGPPKSGKSTLVSNLLRARETNTMFLWGDPVPSGPSVMVTEEAGLAVVRKTEGLTQLDILDRRTFIASNLRSLDHLLEALDLWTATRARALVVIDTLAIWGDIKDENDAMAATHAVAKLALFAQSSAAAVVLVHHARKGGGEHGEAIRGSGAIFATVDQAVELDYTADPLSDNRRLSLAGRLIFPDEQVLGFDRDTNTYAIDTSPTVDPFPIDQFPIDGSGDGLTRKDVEGLWGTSPSSTNKQLKVLTDRKRLVSRSVRSPGDRADHKEYWRQRPLLDVRSVGDRMGDLIKGPED